MPARPVGQEVALLGQCGAGGVPVRAGELGQPLGHSPLERSSGHVAQVLADDPDRTDQVRRAGGPPDLPPRERQALPRRAHGHGPLCHARQGRDRDVPVLVEPEVLVGLVSQHHEVGGDRLRSEGTELCRGEDRPGGVVRRVHDQHPAPGGDPRPQGRRVGPECPWDRWDSDPDSAGEVDRGGVQVEPGLEHQDLVPGLHEGQHRGHDRLGGTRWSRPRPWPDPRPARTRPPGGRRSPCGAREVRERAGTAPHGPRGSPPVPRRGPARGRPCRGSPDRG